jgi:hypothetical protein
MPGWGHTFPEFERGNAIRGEFRISAPCCAANRLNMLSMQLQLPADVRAVSSVSPENSIRAPD